MENIARPLTLRQLFKNKISRPINSFKKKINWKGWNSKEEPLLKFFQNFFSSFFSFFLFLFVIFALYYPFFFKFQAFSWGRRTGERKIFPREKKNRMCKKWHAKEHSLSIAVSLTTMVNRNRHAPSCLPFLARLFLFLSQLIS